MNAHPVASAYGVEIAAGRFTVVRAHGRKGAPTFETLAESADPGSAAWTALRDRIQRDCAAGRAVLVCAAPAQDSFIRPVEAPFPSLKKAAAVFPSLLDVQLPFPLEKCLYAFCRARRGDAGNVSAVAAAIPAERLSALLESCRTVAGLDPEVIAPESLVLWKSALLAAPPSSARPRVILYLGADHTVAVAGRGDLPLVSISARSPWPTGDAVADEKLVQRLRQQIAGALGAADGPAPLFIAGGPGVAGSDGLRDALGVDPACWHRLPSPTTCFAIALAAEGLAPDAWSVNLRAGSHRHANLVRMENRHAGRHLGLVAASALLLAAVSVGSVLYAQRRHAELQDLVRRRAADLTGITAVPRGQETLIARRHVDETGERFKTFNAWSESTAYPEFSVALREAHRLGMTVETIAARPASLLVRGTGAGWDDADALAAPWQARGWKVEIERKDAGVDERVHFTLRAQP